MGRLFKVFKSTLIEYEIFKIEKTTTTVGHNRKHYTQVLKLLEKESKEKKESILGL